ncbi:MAG: N-acetylmuramoyl-L-alanine amidase, partial [Bacteroidales bacterium]|nr:N-acetylmuramoyl-L-alanine amidase [Bacteroidales bacterium]
MLTHRNFLAVLSAFALLWAAFPAAGQDIRLKTVVIDPGHGGKDAGCISPSGKTMEKTIALDIGRRLSRKIKAGCPDVKVVMTRTEDVCFGSYGPHDEIVVLNQEQFARRLADQEKERARKQAEGIFDPSTFGLSKYVGLSMETIIDDGVICCV